MSKISIWRFVIDFVKSVKIFKNIFLKDVLEMKTDSVQKLTALTFAGCI